MCDAWDRTPSDVNPPTNVCETFAAMVEARNRFWSEKVVDLTDYRRKRIMDQQLGLDLANAFRSMDAAKYDPLQPMEPA